MTTPASLPGVIYFRLSLLSVDGMCSDVSRYDSVSVYVKRDSQISFDHYCIHCPVKKRRQLMYLVCAETRVKRISFEDFPDATN
jgi:hypothetical protein